MMLPASQGRFQAATQARLGGSASGAELLSWFTLGAVADVAMVRCLAKRKQAFMGKPDAIA